MATITTNNLLPHQTVNRAWKFYQNSKTQNGTDVYYAALEKYKKDLASMIIIHGAVEVMSKQAILRLCAMENSWRFVALHSFLIYMSQGMPGE